VSDLVVLAFDNMYDADLMREDLLRMQREHIIELDDAAVVIRNLEGKVKVNQIADLTGAGAIGGAFWGMLIGLIFLVPLFGLVVGAAAGALSGKYANVGVDHEFLKDVGSTINPGNSALFLLVRGGTPDKVVEGLRKYKNVKILKTSFSREQEEQLKEAFTEKKA
jgi:uncharacterized membrane protein